MVLCKDLWKSRHVVVQDKTRTLGLPGEMICLANTSWGELAGSFTGLRDLIPMIVTCIYVERISRAVWKLITPIQTSSLGIWVFPTAGAAFTLSRTPFDEYLLLTASAMIDTPRSARGWFDWGCLFFKSEASSLSLEYHPTASMPIWNPPPTNSSSQLKDIWSKFAGTQLPKSNHEYSQLGGNQIRILRLQAAERSTDTIECPFEPYDIYELGNQSIMPSHSLGASRTLSKGSCSGHPRSQRQVLGGHESELLLWR